MHTHHTHHLPDQLLSEVVDTLPSRRHTLQCCKGRMHSSLAQSVDIAQELAQPAEPTRLKGLVPVRQDNSLTLALASVMQHGRSKEGATSTVGGDSHKQTHR